MRKNELPCNPNEEYFKNKMEELLENCEVIEDE
jgi:hypothetical protein